MERKKRSMVFLVACIQNILCAGAIFGWSAISNTLLIDENNGPGLDYDTVKQIYIIASVASFCSPLPLGALMDWLGPRVCNVTSMMLTGVGCLVCGLSNSTNSKEFFTIGMVTFAFGGTGCQVSTMHTANLFPGAESLMTSLLTAGFNLSFTIFLLFSKLWEKTEISYKTMFLTYSCTIFCFGLLGVLYFPDEPYRSSQVGEGHQRRTTSPDMRREASEIFEPLEEKCRTSSVDGMIVQKPSEYRIRQLFSGGLNRIPSERFDKERLEQLRNQMPHFDIKRASLLDQLRSPIFLRMLLFYTIGSLWGTFECGFFGIFLEDRNFLSSSELSLMLQLFVTFNLVFGTVSTPIFGMVADKCGYPCALQLGITTAILYCLCFMSKSIILIFIGFVLYPSYCSFQVIYMYGKLGNDLGYRFFGILSGICSFTAGLVGLAQDLIVKFGTGTCHLDPSPSCSEGNWTTVMLIQLACFAAMMVLLPLFEEKDQQKVHKAPSRKTKKVSSPLSQVGPHTTLNNSISYQMMYTQSHVNMQIDLETAPRS